MAPEQIHGPSTRRSDVFAMGIVLWEALSGERLFVGASQGETLGRVLLANVPDVRSKSPGVSDVLARAVAQSLRRRPEDRFATALEFAHELRGAGPFATRADVARWLDELAGHEVEARAREVATLEASASRSVARASEVPRRARSVPARTLLVALGVAGALAAVFAGTRSRSHDAAAAPQPTGPYGGPPFMESPPEHAEVVSTEQEKPAPTATALHTKVEPPRHPRHTPKPDCTPPFLMENGRKVYKRECF
jgi:serine/threonine-protein kinase